MIKRTGKATGQEKAELNACELRGQRCELQTGSSHPLLLPPAQQFLGTNVELPPSVTPAFLEHSWGWEQAMAAQIRHRNAALAAPALMCGTAEIIFLFNDCMTVGGGPGGRVSLYWPLFGREKTSSGLQLPRKAEVKALSSVTGLSFFHESPLPAINLSHGNPCLLL